MIESIGNSITDYAKQQRELLASKENSVKSAETSEASASSDAAAIANSEQQVSDTEQVKTRAPQYDTVEISEEGMQMAKQQANSAGALNAAESIDSTEESEESSSSTATKDLSSYSEDELDDMVDEGTITQLEKNTELARRAAEEATDEQDSDNSAVTSDEMINVSGQTAMEDEE